jgi:hypothetical protein
MSVTTYPAVRFDQMSRKQAIITCLALEDMRDRTVAEVARLRAGECAPDDVQAPDCWPTPAQFIRQWNDLPAEQRLVEAARIINSLEREFSARLRGVVEGRSDGEETA